MLTSMSSEYFTNSLRVYCSVVYPSVSEFTKTELPIME